MSSIIKVLTSKIRSFLTSTVVLAMLLKATSSFAAIPVANNDKRIVPLNTPITINVLINDTDADNDPITVISVSEAANGSVEIVNGAIRYTPNVGFSGSDNFTYQVSDGQDESNSAVVEITVTNEILTTLSNTANDKSVASALDAACRQLLTSEGSLTEGQLMLKERCSELQILAVTDSVRTTRLINQIAPEETIALMRSAINNNQSHASAVQNRLIGIGQGINTISINGLTLNSNNIFGGAAGDEAGLASKFGVFLSLQLENTEKEKTTFENGFDQETSGFTVGMDYRLNNTLVIGAAAGYSDSSLEYLQQDGKVDSDNTMLISYLMFDKNTWGADFQLGYGINNFDIERQIIYVANSQDVTSVAEGTTSGDQLFARVSTQYNWHFKSLNISPRLSITHQKTSINSYTENNSAGFTVTLDDQHISRTTLDVGLLSQYVFNFNWGVLIPQLDVSMLSDNGDQEDIRGEFAFSPIDKSYFVLDAENADSAYGMASLGASWVLPHGISGFIKYDQIVGYKDLESNRINLGFRFEI